MGRHRIRGAALVITLRQTTSEYLRPPAREGARRVTLAEPNQTLARMKEHFPGVRALDLSRKGTRKTRSFLFFLAGEASTPFFRFLMRAAVLTQPGDPRPCQKTFVVVIT